MANYELIFVTKPNLDDETREVVSAKVKGIIEAANGEIESIDVWGNRKLAYPIQKFTDGFYTLVNFKAESDVPKELDRNLKINENVIRHMIVVAE